MIVITIKRINKILIVFMVIAVTVLFNFSVSAAEIDSSDIIDNFSLEMYDSQSSVFLDCELIVENVGSDVLVTVRPKDQLEFLLLIDKGYLLDLTVDFSSHSYKNIIFDDSLPLDIGVDIWGCDLIPTVSPFVYTFDTQKSNPYYSCFYISVFDNLSEISFALSNDYSFVFSDSSEPNGFLVFLSDVVILFENSLAWFSELFGNISRSAPLLILVCGFVIVGFSFSLLRRVQR